MRCSQNIREKFHLDEPFFTRFWIYLKGLPTFDLGDSFTYKRPVMDIIKESLPWSIKLAIVAEIIIVIFGILAGIISAISRYSFWDVLVTISTSVLVAMPIFWIGRLLQLFFAQWLGWLPAAGAPPPGTGFRAAAHILHHARRRAGGHLHRLRRPHAALLAAGGDAPGLYPDRPRQGAVQPQGDLQACVSRTGSSRWSPTSASTSACSSAPRCSPRSSSTGRASDIRSTTPSCRETTPWSSGPVFVLVLIFVFINLLVDISYAFLDPRIRLGGGQEVT